MQSGKPTPTPSHSLPPPGRLPSLATLASRSSTDPLPPPAPSRRPRPPRLSLNTPSMYSNASSAPKSAGLLDGSRPCLSPVAGQPSSAPFDRVCFPIDSPPSTSTSPTGFIVSTIIPGFLYLGPDPTLPSEEQQLHDIGVKRILNMAVECEDELGLASRFDEYRKVGMRDCVEEVGVTKGLAEACAFLDEARSTSSPTYVHCRAGKSRSVTVVLAYLIHANRWSLKQAYAFVLERRRGISPNIGFMAELMAFEESEFGRTAASPSRSDEVSTVDSERSCGLPPAWSRSESRATGGKGMDDVKSVTDRAKGLSLAEPFTSSSGPLSLETVIQSG